MNRTTRTIGLTSAAVLALATPALATASHRPGADHHPRVQVMHLRVVPVSSFDTNPGYVALDDDYNRAGRRVGSDVTTCRPVHGTADAARCDVGLGLADGMITVTFVETASSQTAHGHITGGTGEYAGAHGRVVIKETRDGADVTLTIRR